MSETANPASTKTSAAQTPVELVPPREAALALRKLRGHLVRNALRFLAGESRLRLVVILGCSLVFWVLLFGFFYAGFDFVNNFEVFAKSIIDYAFSLYFLSLMAMIFFSVGIICYNSLFLSREADFLLTLPASADRIFAFKFAESMAFACWGFLLIGSPLMLAYGIASGASPLFYLVFLPYLAAFVLIPGCSGAIAAFLVGRFLPRRHKTVLGIGAALLLAMGIFLAVWVLQSPGEAFSSDWMNGLLGRLAFSQDPLLPSVWITRGLTGSASGDWDSAFFYLMTTLANGLMLYLAAALTARLVYRTAFGQVQGGRSARRMVTGQWLDEVFHKVFAIAPRPIRLLVLKDLRLFRRDPAQWSQFLILFGLLGFYFLMIRKLGHDAQSPAWRNLLSFLNLTVTSLLLSTFTSRFVFPLLSLEGRNFWVLGLLPIHRDAILWSKFAFASGAALATTLPMTVLSDAMLRMNGEMILIHAAMMVLICLGLAGISVGLGARFPNLREPDPSKIAAGFGGTVNLLISVGFILAVVVSMAIPSHFYLNLNDQNLSWNASAMWDDSQFQTRFAICSVICAAVGAAAIVIPMRMGMKSFREMEF